MIAACCIRLSGVDPEVRIADARRVARARVHSGEKVICSGNTQNAAAAEVVLCRGVEGVRAE